MINSFTGKNYFLSNFYMSHIEFDGIEYPSNEHAFQAQKTLDIEARKEVPDLLYPRHAKSWGNHIELREDWEDVKVPLMYEICVRKFEHDLLRTWLVSTGTQTLVEGNHWGDTFWGVCNNKGQNKLGKILMIIREEINANSN